MTLTSHGTSQQGIAISHRVRRDIHEAARIHSRRLVMRADIIVAEAGGKTNFNNNMLQKELREELLASFFGQKDTGDLRYFTNLPLSVLQELIDHGFVEMSPWNECPGMTEVFLPFMRRNPGFTAHGYAASWNRSDARVTIEGVEKAGSLPRHELIDFFNTFHWADELEVADDYARCWYD